MAAFADTPLRAQAPAVELEGYYARAEAPLIEVAALPALDSSIPTVCALPAPNRDAIAGAALRMPSTTRDEMDASLIHFAARVSNLPRSTVWESYR
jgi:hypothetical protein